MSLVILVVPLMRCFACHVFCFSVLGSVVLVLPGCVQNAAQLALASTLLDAVAAAASSEVDLKLVDVAERVLTGKCTLPHVPVGSPSRSSSKRDEVSNVAQAQAKEYNTSGVAATFEGVNYVDLTREQARSAAASLSDEGVIALKVNVQSGWYFRPDVDLKGREASKVGVRVYSDGRIAFMCLAHGKPVQCFKMDAWEYPVEYCPVPRTKKDSTAIWHETAPGCVDKIRFSAADEIRQIIRSTPHLRYGGAGGSGSSASSVAAAIVKRARSHMTADA